MPINPLPCTYCGWPEKDHGREDVKERKEGQVIALNRCPGYTPENPKKIKSHASKNKMATENGKPEPDDLDDDRGPSNDELRG